MIGRNVLYLVDPSDPNQLPASPGIYFLSDGIRLYCGEGKNLRVRVPASLRYHRFGRFAILYPLVSSDKEKLKPRLQHLEAFCISALHTVIFGHGLPHDLRNQNHSKLLPTGAWSVQADSYQLPIKIAQTVLFATGVPKHMTGLPDQWIFGTGLCTHIRQFHISIWEKLISEELSLRERPGHPRSPLPLVQLKGAD